MTPKKFQKIIAEKMPDLPFDERLALFSLEIIVYSTELSSKLSGHLYRKKSIRKRQMMKKMAKIILAISSICTLLHIDLDDVMKDAIDDANNE